MLVTLCALWNGFIRMFFFAISKCREQTDTTYFAASDRSDRNGVGIHRQLH
jgi:hypothetical protein